MDKTALRQKIRNDLAAITPEQAALFDAQIQSYFSKNQSFMPQSIISLYMPLRGEVSCKAILQTLALQGHTVCLPVVMGRDVPMTFRVYKPGDAVERGMMGPLEPLAGAPEVLPDILLIPMLGFNRARYRLGYGSGFYDRTLAMLRKVKPVKTIGVTYSLQEIADFPCEAHDIPLDMVITEKEVIR